MADGNQDLPPYKEPTDEEAKIQIKELYECLFGTTNFVSHIKSNPKKGEPIDVKDIFGKFQLEYHLDETTIETTKAALNHIQQRSELSCSVSTVKQFLESNNTFGTIGGVKYRVIRTLGFLTLVARFSPKRLRRLGNSDFFLGSKFSLHESIQENGTL
jgi:hypothetical protein